jgi:heme exporter protein D
LVAVDVAVNLAAFAMLVVHSLLRYAARLPSTQNPFRRKSGNRILAAEMKEYDA